jgi:hypothetical protein
MAYSDFSLESALAPRTKTASVKLQGVSRTIDILNNPNRGTEEFIQGAVSSLGSADRMIMYVNGSLEALSDRLMTASKIAKAVNTSKAHGVEGFYKVPTLNPWAYAIEGKASEFFKRIWEAIKTACRRVIEAIAYIIKWIGNAIASMDVKSQVQDYKFYTSKKQIVEKYAKAAKVDKKKINSMNWDINADSLAKLIKTAASYYLKSTQGKDPDMAVMENISRINLSVLHTADDYRKAFSKVFGLGESVGVGVKTMFKGADQKAYGHLTHAVKTMKERIDKGLESDIAAIFGAKKTAITTFNARSIVMGYCTKNSDGKTTEVEVSSLKKSSKDFEVLSEAWLTQNVKSVIASVHQQQKVFTQYTKAIDKVAANFAKTLGNEDNGFKQINDLTASLANSRIRYNSFWSNLMLELEGVALRYRKSVHIALKHYISAAQKGGIDKKKSGESLSSRSVESLFDFE